MARSDAPGQATLRRGGREAQGNTHAGAPELQVPAEKTKTRQEGTRGTELATLGATDERRCEPTESLRHASHHVSCIDPWWLL